jgi:hypothetical protein
MIDPEKLKKACDQSRVFYKAARRCNEFVELPSGHLQYLDVPSRVLYAFSIEVGLKALVFAETGEFPKTSHDLKRAFDSLALATQAAIKSASTDGLSAAYVQGFEDDLEDARKTFEVWRYVYEKHPVDSDLGFLQRLSYGVQKSLDALAS